MTNTNTNTNTHTNTNNQLPMFNKAKQTILYYLYIITNYIIKILKRTRCKPTDPKFYRKIVFFDFETTGLNCYHENIIEYAFLTGEGENETCIESLVNPEKKFDKKISEITGIHPDQLESMTSIDSHKTFIKQEYTVKEFYMVAHNCYGFDKTFLQRVFPEEPSNWYYIDTLVLARKLLPEMYSVSLKSLAKKYNISEGNHRARSDTICLKEIYFILLEILSNKTGTSLQQYKEHPELVYQYCNTPKL